MSAFTAAGNGSTRNGSTPTPTLNGSMPATVRLLIADDFAAVRMGLAAFFRGTHGIEVVGEAADGQEAVTLAALQRPDVVLMDVRMPRKDGIDSTRLIKRLCPETKVLLVSAYEHADLVEAGRAAGADGFVLKGALGAEIAELVREAAG